MNNRIIDVKHRVWKEFSGCLINTESTVYPNPNSKNHMDRAVYLTSLVEVGAKFGLINSYDGAGMSAGLEHKIAVYPKNLSAQGSLWGLLNDIRSAVPLDDCAPLKELLDAFKRVGWTLDSAGVLRDSKTGVRVHGEVIRNELTPPGGKVPKTGPNWEKAKQWAVLFNKVFNHPATFHSQVEAAKKGLLLSNKAVESDAYKKITGVSNPSVLIVGENITPEQDLAWCVYHSHSVNGPAPARDCLRLSIPSTSKDWGKRFLKIIGSRSYGKWKDTKDGNNRYDRTRVLAMGSGLWDASLFSGPNAIMPKDLF
jgi:hypothetical protein